MSLLVVSQNRVFPPDLKTSLPQFAVRKKRSIWYIFRVEDKIQYNAITTTLSYTFRGFQQQLFKITRMIKVQVMQNIMFLNYSSSKIAKNRIFNQSCSSRGLKTVFCLCCCCCINLLIQNDQYLLNRVDFVRNFFPFKVHIF